jgi:hypothetical protein
LLDCTDFRLTNLAIDEVPAEAVAYIAPVTAGS